jgi:hypothetical protein
MFIAEWNDPVVAIAAAVEEPISRHLSHATRERGKANRISVLGRFLR